MLSGLVVASIESSVEAYKRIEVKDGAETYVERVDRITEYGVALMLDPLKEWLSERIPINAHPTQGESGKIGKV